MKRKLFLFLAAFTLLAAFIPQKAEAAQVSGTSAVLATSAVVNPSRPFAKDYRAQALKAYLESYGSPMANDAQTFIDEADKNHLDWKVVAAISGNESNFGLAIPPYSNNGWGFGVYGNNVRRFASWKEGISVVSSALRTDYLGQNPETNVYQIGAKYAADPAWAYKVSHYMYEIDAFSQQFDQPTVSLSL